MYKIIGLLLLTLVAGALTGLGHDLDREVITFPGAILTTICLFTLVITLVSKWDE